MNSNLQAPSLPRQQGRVLVLTALGYPAKLVADSLEIAEDTVKRHKSDLITKYRAKNMIHVVAKAFEKGHLKFVEAGTTGAKYLCVALLALLCTLADDPARSVRMIRKPVSVVRVREV